MAAICVYCGSSPGHDPVFMEAATALGRCLAEGGHTLVYGGGKAGLMGAVADAVLNGGGQVIGVIPEMLAQRELAHGGLTSLHTVMTMHERKFRMASLSDGFIAMPGGIGTLEELVEIFTWSQLRVHAKPCAILNVNGFYEPLLYYMQHMVCAGFLGEDHLKQLLVSDEPSDVITQLIARIA